MIIDARAAEGTPVGPGQAGLKSNHQLEWAWLMLLLTGAELGSGVSQRVAPDHSYQPHCLLHSFPQSAWPNPPPISATIVSNARYRTTAPISYEPPAYPSLPPLLLPVTADFLRLPGPGFVPKQNCLDFLRGIFGRISPRIGFRPLSRPRMKYSFLNNVWSAAYHSQSTLLDTQYLQLPQDFATVSSMSSKTATAIIGHISWISSFIKSQIPPSSSIIKSLFLCYRLVY